MTEQEILEGNKLLSLFMGETINIHQWGDNWAKVLSLNITNTIPRYDKFWDWIMPVWIKFRDLNIDSKEYSDWLSSLSWYMYSANEPKALFERLVYAIKWYNEQKK